MDRLILDFEKETLTIETDFQQGTEFCSNLKEKKAEIYKLLGYGEANMRPFVDAIEDILNGRATSEEAAEKLAKWLKEE